MSGRPALKFRFTSGHAIDPVIFGHGLLALFGLGLLATLIVRGRRRPMGHICFGLAALESASVVAWSWGYVPTTRGLVMASVTIGALYLAGLLFLRMPATPSPESDDAVRESGAWNIARVISIVAALLAWGGVAAAYAHTGAIPWTLAAWGVAFAALPLVRRSALPQAGALAGSLAVASLALLLALAPSPASADPPYDDDFDAPEFFSDAALISPNTPAGVNRGQYEFFTPDIDYYKFSVSQGQDISITCTEYPYPYEFTGTGFVQHPCSARLVDPAGLDRSSSISSDGVSTYLSVNDAVAGDWRLEISGADEGYTLCCEKALYFFSVELTPAADGSSNAPGAAGSFGYAGSLLLAAAVLLRKRRRLVAAGFLSLLSFAAAAQQDLSDKPIQPGAPIVIHVGPTQDTPSDVATMNFVFEDAGNTYIGAAGHAISNGPFGSAVVSCTSTNLVGERVSSPDIGEFGTVVFCVVSGEGDDFALIRVDTDKLGMVSPVVRGFGAAPAGFTTSDETCQGDLLFMHGWGIPLSAHAATRDRYGVLTHDSANGWEAAMPISVNDSGAPVIRSSDHKALGIALAVGAGASGITVERILFLLAEAGFNVTLVTEASGTESSSDAKSTGQPVAGTLTPMLLLPLALVALRRLAIWMSRRRNPWKLRRK
jgi:hypothetical protein